MSSSRRLGLTLGSALLMWSLAVGSAHAARPKVASVDNGVVLLGGSNQAIAQKLRAIETAYDCAGVRHVASQIETSDK